ncbi:MAG: hypothetical protein ACI97B_003502, partial [Verrucomicrobiales bacterium]
MTHQQSSISTRQLVADNTHQNDALQSRAPDLVAKQHRIQPFGDNSFGNALSTVSTYGYGYDAEHKRKHAIHSGDAFTTDHFVKYGYNDRDEVESA